MGAADITTLSNMDVLLGLCEKKFVMAEAAAAKHALALRETQHALAEGERRFEAELRKHLWRIKDLQEDRKVLAAEVQVLREKAAPIAQHRQKVLDTPIETEKAAKDLVGGDAVWRKLTWSEKYGVISVTPMIMDSKKRLERKISTVEKKLSDEQTEREMQSSQTHKLRKQMSLVQDLADARIRQVGTEKERSADIAAELARANERVDELAAECADLREALANAEDQLETAMALQTPTYAAAEAREAMSHFAGAVPDDPVREGVVLSESVGEGLRLLVAANVPEETPILARHGAPTALDVGALGCQMTTSTEASPRAEDALLDLGGPAERTSSLGLPASPDASAGKHDIVVKRLMAKLKQLADEKAALSAQLADGDEALEHEREEVTKQRQFYTELLEKLQRAEEPETAQMADALSRSQGRIETLEAEKQDVEDILADVRSKCEVFYTRQKAKREELAEQLDAARAEALNAQQTLAKERELWEGQVKELEILRGKLNMNPWKDCGTQTEVDEDLQADMIDLLAEEVLLRTDIALTEHRTWQLCNSHDAETATDPVFIDVPQQGRPALDVSRASIPDFQLDVVPPSPIAFGQMPPQPEMPRTRWERHAPDPVDVADNDVVEVHAQLRLEATDNLECTTVVIIQDNETVGDLLWRGVGKINRKLGLNLRPETYALTVSEQDDRALQEYVDEDDTHYIMPDSAPPFSTLFLTRSRPEPREGPKRDPNAEYCYSNRPLRTLALMHHAYEACEMIAVKRLWFTLHPARNPLPIPMPSPKAHPVRASQARLGVRTTELPLPDADAGSKAPATGPRARVRLSALATAALPDNDPPTPTVALDDPAPPPSSSASATPQPRPQAPPYPEASPQEAPLTPPPEPIPNLQDSRTHTHPKLQPSSAVQFLNAGEQGDPPRRTSRRGRIGSHQPQREPEPEGSGSESDNSPSPRRQGRGRPSPSPRTIRSPSYSHPKFGGGNGSPRSSISRHNQGGRPAANRRVSRVPGMAGQTAASPLATNPYHKANMNRRKTLG